MSKCKTHWFISRNEVLYEFGVWFFLTDDAIVFVLIDIVVLYGWTRINHDYSTLIFVNIVSHYLQIARMNNIYTHSWALVYRILNDERMMRIETSYCNIALNIVTNIILFNHSITILNDKNSFFKIFINFVSINSWECLFFYFNSWLFIESNDMIV